MDSISVQVAADHIESLTKIRKPLIAVEELIWNSLDADATAITVGVITNHLNGVERVVVSDDGLGIPRGQWKDAFGHLGGSPKLHVTSTPSGRRPHGKCGRGRFKAFGLGTTVRWRSRFRDNGNCFEYDITGKLASIRDFEATDQRPATSQTTGVEVEISGIDRNIPSLLDFVAVAEELARRLALYLRQYPGINIRIGGVLVDPKSVEDQVSTYPIEVPIQNAPPISAELTVIEWKHPMERAIYLCDADGFAHDEHAPGIRAPGFNFTAYVKAEIVSQLADDNAFTLGEIHPTIKSLLDTAKAQLKVHFREREAARSADLVRQWQEEKVYPYTEITNNPIEIAEREVFDVCAIKVYEYSPWFEGADQKNKELTFRLIRQALESNPSSLQRILREVFSLPQEHQDELANLLCKTRLTAIINAARVVTDRLDFLAGLDPLLFGTFNKSLNEPRHLHRILAEEIWLFGEQYALGVDEESLRNLLKSHVQILGRADLVEDLGEVKDLEGKDRRLDLMLYRTYPQMTPDHFEHLVIELKRPSIKLGKEEIGQIEDYAFKVARDSRFNKSNTQWTFLLVGNELDDFAQEKCKVADREYGHIHAGNPNILVKTWSTLISQAKWRYEFFRQRLEYQVSTAEGVAYLRRKHGDRMPPNPAAAP